MSETERLVDEFGSDVPDIGDVHPTLETIPDIYGDPDEEEVILSGDGEPLASYVRLGSTEVLFARSANGIRHMDIEPSAEDLLEPAGNVRENVRRPVEALTESKGEGPDIWPVLVSESLHARLQEDGVLPGFAKRRNSDNYAIKIVPPGEWEAQMPDRAVMHRSTEALVDAMEDALDRGYGAVWPGYCEEGTPPEVPESFVSMLVREKDRIDNPEYHWHNRDTTETEPEQFVEFEMDNSFSQPEVERLEAGEDIKCEYMRDQSVISIVMDDPREDLPADPEYGITSDGELRVVGEDYEILLDLEDRMGSPEDLDLTKTGKGYLVELE